MTLFLHIGIGKTGTTSIQRSLLAHRDALKNEGILFPSAGLRGHAHFGLYDNALTKDQWVSAIDALARECAEFSGHVVVSSENLSYAPPEAIEELKAALPVEPNIVFYCRPQIDLIESAFLYWVQLGWDYRGSIDNFWQYHWASFDFNARVEPWAQRFGDDKIIAHVYDRRVVGPDVAQHFFKLIGSRIQPNGQRFNQRLLPELFEVITKIDADAKNPSRREMIQALLSVSEKLGPASKESLISPELAKNIGSRYEESNLLFANKYLPKNEGALLRPANWSRVL